MKAEWDTKLVELGLDAEIIQILEKNDVEDWMQLTQKSAGEFKEMGLTTEQISKIFLTVKENMH